MTSCDYVVVQIGNAVPPPLAKALGLEIREAMGKNGQS